MNEITYDRRYGTLTPEVEAKLILSQQEAANAQSVFLLVLFADTESMRFTEMINL